MYYFIQAQIGDNPNVQEKPDVLFHISNFSHLLAIMAVRSITHFSNN